MTNFNFLKQQFPEIYKSATQAESLTYTAPRASCFYARFTLEQAVIWLYENDPYLKLPFDNSLGALIHEKTFQDNLTPGLFSKIRLIHKLGNKAAHDARSIDSKDALHINQELFHFLYWLTRYYSPEGKQLKEIKFTPELIPQQQQPELNINQLQELETKLNQTEKLKQITEIKAQQTEAELQQLKATIEANKLLEDTHDYNEADTRKYIIDVLLKEVGWSLEDKDNREFPVTGMPNKTGKGSVDYVLWGKDGLPLALVEAKRTTKDPRKGKIQAKLYADCLEKQFKQRPLIFYTNGYQTWFWDDLNYPPREIQGFLKREELETIIFRRSNKKKLNLITINQEIVNRPYQIEAIKRLNQDFTNNHRKGLLVMATGTGKTRTTIALIDLLIKAGWVKKVLFLADRNPLLKQAKRAFNSHTPQLNVVNLYESIPQEAALANVVLSTYPTLLNRIDLIIDNQRLFSAGHFDLIVVDEAHRSIYQKYRQIFYYFDSLLLGLTATPRDEIDRDTYQIFDLDTGNPTFAYELEDGIKDGYLVPPRGIKVPFKFMQKGIKYNELSPQEKEEYEAKFRDEDTGEIPSQVDAKALNRWLFNKNTVDQALELLMNQGIKIEGGDRLGKTIIFAKNHKHAEFIVERFDHNYPHLKGHFCQIIDSHDNYAQSLLDDFEIANKEPTIAVSVDMLDTGVDVPEVVNLVFFKPVYSRVKFNQMIGRGTRLCPDLFGVNQDKTEFLVFDLCSNFEYFDQEIKEKESKLQPSLTTRLTQTRLLLSQQLETNHPLRNNLLDNLHHQVSTLEKNNFLVRPHLQTVEEFSDRNRWNNLNNDDLKNINQKLASLPTTLPSEKREAKEFDLLCLKLQISILEGIGAFDERRIENRELEFDRKGLGDFNFIKLRDKMRDLLSNLETKQTIPMVKQQLPLIESIQAESWWEDVTVEMIEEIRLKLRNLIQFIDKQQQQIVITNFEDELGELEEKGINLNTTGFSPYQYRKKVEAYIRANQDHIAINKLKRNLPLTETDLQSLETMLFESEEVESKAHFEEVFGKQINLKLFIRNLIGLDRSTAKQAFSKYLENTKLTANQIRFIENIIDYLTQNGVMDIGLLYEPPFTDFHTSGLDGVFNESDADSIVEIITSFNDTVEAA
jgi:type I restriction enzyme R subunit